MVPPLCPLLVPLHLPDLFTSQSQVLCFCNCISHIIWIHQVPPERWWVPKLNRQPNLSPDSKLILNDLDISSWCLINFLNSAHPKWTDLLITSLLSSFLYLSEIPSFLLLKLKNFWVILDSSLSFATCKPSTGTFLVVQWLGLCDSTAGRLGLIYSKLHWGRGAKKKKYTRANTIALGYISKLYLEANHVLLYLSLSPWVQTAVFSYHSCLHYLFLTQQSEESF